MQFSSKSNVIFEKNAKNWPENIYNIVYACEILTYCIQHIQHIFKMLENRLKKMYALYVLYGNAILVPENGDFHQKSLIWKFFFLNFNVKIKRCRIENKILYWLAKLKVRSPELLIQLKSEAFTPSFGLRGRICERFRRLNPKGKMNFL